MKIEKLDTELLTVGVLVFSDYCTPYIESSYNELNIVVQAFRPMLDKIEKIENLIIKSERLKEGSLEGKCIGENEEIITHSKGFFQFSTSTLSREVCLELEESCWISLLNRIKSHMNKENGKTHVIKF